ncbi:MAG: cation:dicarboxylase symporter family transporter, partial [Candidatus Acidiferrum sp.]
MTFSGLLLFTAGATLSILSPSNTFSVWLRWFALILLAIAGLTKRSLTFWIFFSMLVGLEIGLDHPQFAAHLRIFSDIFLRLIKVIVAPLILGTLITGIAGHGDLRKVGRIGLKSLVYFEAVTTIALFIGIFAINISKAGQGLVLPPPAAAAEQIPQSPSPLHWDDFLLHIFPENIVKAIGDNQILQVAVFAVLFGIALTRVPEATRQPILSLAESLTQTMFRFTNIVMYYAPIGVGAAMAYTVGHMGISVLLPLGKLLLTAYAALLFFLLFVLLPIA